MLLLLACETANAHTDGPLANRVSTSTIIYESAGRDGVVLSFWKTDRRCRQECRSAAYSDIPNPEGRHLH